MKKTFFILICFYQLHIAAQQVQQVSQYFNELIYYNPAVAGAEHCGRMGANVRKQWAGLEGAPFTQSAFIHGRVGNKNGLGLVLNHDQAGVAGMLEGQVIYAFHAVSTNTTRLSFGISAQYKQYTFDESGFKMIDLNDPQVTYQKLSEWFPDVSFGTYFKNEHFDLGLGADQLIHSFHKPATIDFLVRHYFLHSSATFDLNRTLALKPSIFFKTTDHFVFSYDLSIRAILKDQYQSGLSFRKNDGVVVYGGIRLGKLWLLYDYDINTSKLFKYNGGSHEFELIYEFCSTKQRGNSGPRGGYHSGGRKSQHTCPAYD